MQEQTLNYPNSIWQMLQSWCMAFSSSEAGKQKSATSTPLHTQGFCPQIIHRKQNPPAVLETARHPLLPLSSLSKDDSLCLGWFSGSPDRSSLILRGLSSKFDPSNIAWLGDTEADELGHLVFNFYSSKRKGANMTSGYMPLSPTSKCQLWSFILVLERCWG